MSTQQKRYDAIVVGGGMVGAAAALGLSQAGFSVALIEHQAPEPFDSKSVPDLRISAIGQASVALLARLGAWDAISQMRLVPYRGLETWEWRESKVLFDAQSLSLPELGYMLENRVLQLGLWQQFTQADSLSLYCPDKITQMRRNDGIWQIELNSGKTISSRLIIGADGANSAVRQVAGIGVTGWQYRQSCMLITVQTQQLQQDVTWQRFYPSGPRAFLPLFDGWASLVWYDSPARIRQLQQMPMDELSNEIMDAFPDRLGSVKAVAAGSFPLIRRHAQDYFKLGCVLVGDAAHTINPLAGQGVNLGYRDIDALLQVLIAAKAQGEDISSDSVLMRYQKRRRPDNLLMQTGMDVFYKTFSNDIMPIKLVRNLGLMAAQRAGKLKQWALKYALGL